MVRNTGGRRQARKQREASHHQVASRRVDAGVSEKVVFQELFTEASALLHQAELLQREYDSVVEKQTVGNGGGLKDGVEDIRHECSLIRQSAKDICLDLLANHLVSALEKNIHRSLWEQAIVAQLTVYGSEFEALWNQAQKDGSAKRRHAAFQELEQAFNVGIAVCNEMILDGMEQAGQGDILGLRKAKGDSNKSSIEVTHYIQQCVLWLGYIFDRKREVARKYSVWSRNEKQQLISPDHLEAVAKLSALAAEDCFRLASKMPLSPAKAYNQLACLSGKCHEFLDCCYWSSLCILTDDNQKGDGLIGSKSVNIDHMRFSIRMSSEQADFGVESQMMRSFCLTFCKWYLELIRYMCDDEETTKPFIGTMSDPVNSILSLTRQWQDFMTGSTEWNATYDVVLEKLLIAMLGLLWYIEHPKMRNYSNAIYMSMASLSVLATTLWVNRDMIAHSCQTEPKLPSTLAKLFKLALASFGDGWAIDPSIPLEKQQRLQWVQLPEDEEYKTLAMWKGLRHHLSAHKLDAQNIELICAERLNRWRDVIVAFASDEKFQWIHYEKATLNVSVIDVEEEKTQRTDQFMHAMARERLKDQVSVLEQQVVSHQSPKGKQRQADTGQANKSLAAPKIRWKTAIVSDVNILLERLEMIKNWCGGRDQARDLQDGEPVQYEIVIPHAVIQDLDLIKKPGQNSARAREIIRFLDDSFAKYRRWKPSRTRNGQVTFVRPQLPDENMTWSEIWQNRSDYWQEDILKNPKIEWEDDEEEEREEDEKLLDILFPEYYDAYAATISVALRNRRLGFPGVQYWTIDDSDEYIAGGLQPTLAVKPVVIEMFF
ncbi:hypothetical protein BZG36_01251 [Bifiguratus adelaidae]|uniref:PIN domain-containing protein n=1 Tax=Bifiguratus adelaidae TaxID=1938954 RepID=A0A261Y5W3_9FUNG|nr:hypothetical protein BZG36_01251 [Bifiguratus adelaidae]